MLMGIGTGIRIMHLNKEGLTEADVVMRNRIASKLDVKGRELSTLTRNFAEWRKGWNKVVLASQAKFNRLRRLQCADDHGECVCVCTGERYPFTQIDAGHYISATKQATRFDPVNVHPQSKHSNNHTLGDDAKIYYTMWMMERYGREAIERLIAKSKTQKSWRDHKEELLALRVVWERETKSHKKRLGI